MDAEPPRRGWWMTKRFLIASLGVALLSGGVTAVLALNEVGKLVDALGLSRAVKLAPAVLAPTTGGAPETLLLVGNDQRPPPKRNPGGSVLPHSNEMLLVRIDPSKPTISMLSIPRELQVAIHPPGQLPVVTRINAAYTLGGIQLMTETIKRVLGLSINHVFVVTFPKFKRAVDEMGCVYMTVDRRYHHVNEPGGEQYFEINLQPGYQRLCGEQALEFVANRHEDTSLVRDARDQRFLLEVKAQYGATLFENRDKFERILGRAVETDLHGTGQVLDLLALLVQSQGKPVRQVPFQVNLLPTYDTASPQQIHESVLSFLTGTALISKRKINSALHKARPSRRGAAQGLGLLPTPGSALAHARSEAPNLPFPLEYPRVRDSSAGASADTLRLYGIRDQHRHVHPIYTIVVDRGGLGEFYDVQGTSWTDPPLLSSPSQTVRIGRRTYGLFYTGEQIRVIAWREDNAAYWIQNTLTNSLSPRAMLTMAEQAVPVAGGVGSMPSATSSPQGFNLPPRAARATSRITKIGSLLGLVGLAVVALLSLLVLNRQRELGVLREQVAQALAVEVRQRPLLAAAGLLGGERAPDVAEALPGTPTIYRAARRLRRGALAVVVIAALGIALGVGVFVLRSGSSPRPAPGGFPIPVAVFNATGKPGAAHRIAGTLGAARVHVTEVGDINANLAPGVYVLYPPRDREEAGRVARLIPTLSPTVTPIQPQVQSVIGRQNEIVVVLD
jgi:LCP family protein required for cell wall assembly